MARVSGATVLLILVATVSFYTCAILAGAALGRRLDMQPAADSTLQVSVSVSFRGLVQDLAKELWGGYHREIRSGGGAHTEGNVRTAAALQSSAARASLPLSQAELEILQYRVRQNMLAQRTANRMEISRNKNDGVHEGAATELWRGHHSEGRSGGGAHASAGRAAVALPSSAARVSLPLSPAERQRQNMLFQREAIRREISRRDGVHERAATAKPEYSEGRPRTGSGDGAASLSAANHQIMMQQVQVEALNRDVSRGGRMASSVQQTARPLSLVRHGDFSGEITEGTLPGGGAVKVGPWGGAGGQAFYMRNGRRGSPPRLLSVTLYHAEAVHAFSFQYIHGGVVQTTGPYAGEYYGSKGVRAMINFASDEHLTAVEGTFGRSRSVPAKVVVTSLTFRTNKGRTYGPYGEENGTPFSIPAANGCIVGFWGRSGWLLDAIGVYIMPCQVYNPTFSVSNAYE